MRRNEKQFIVLVVGFLVIILAALATWALSNSGIAAVVADSGTLMWITIQMIYVVFFDSRSRWPGLTSWQRFTNVITFRR